MCACVFVCMYVSVYVCMGMKVRMCVYMCLYVSVYGCACVAVVQCSHPHTLTKRFHAGGRIILFLVPIKGWPMNGFLANLKQAPGGWANVHLTLA